MIPTSCLRETIILVIFGIVLVPIAAKRAHHAPPGYGQTFSKELSSLTWYNRESALLLSKVPRVDDPIAYRPSPPLAEQAFEHNETLSILYATDSAPYTETSAPLTIRFQISTARDQTAMTTTSSSSTVTGSSGEAMATTAPRSASATTQPPPAVVKASSDASRGSWRLIWMGSAIAAVAVFMMSC
ncbi:hypothetical protein M406DRAFT_355070 [Cryphonectria parasitica EP155]|uniref:Uncharacterized protein n=1 Tax=Cryphonectria parasitica (strain ATCC 38755 / EP155) TaxID=660469 RepID=A0A9P4Y8W0_CRYP1|nr:uncharacterized protein M406DRAFT_355070 [Cryphonectria parasitica EP155]KAF3768901.1 hypothetical protein M406DRAFT_355070 [Cryphonectria parasitica EP155]